MSMKKANLHFTFGRFIFVPLSRRPVDAEVERRQSSCLNLQRMIYIYIRIYIYGYIRQHSWQMYLDLHIVGWLVHFFRCFPRRSTMFVRFCLPKVLPHMEAASWTLKLGDFTDISQMC